MSAETRSRGHRNGEKSAARTRRGGGRLSLERLESRLLLSAVVETADAAQSGAIEGQVVWEPEGTGQEVPIPGARVYLDADEDGNLDTGETACWTNIHGEYAFQVEPGMHRVAQVLPDDWEAVDPQGGSHTVHVSDDETVSDLDFYNRPPLDFGDLPDSYGTTLQENGPRHIVGALPFGELHLGQQIDSEPDGQPQPDAFGDGPDEDGVLFTRESVEDDTATVSVNASAEGLLDAWVDWNANGHFEPHEQVFESRLLEEGDNELSFQVPDPDDVPDELYSRWRLSSHGGLSPTGPALNGEVEDVLVEMAEPVEEIASYTYPSGVTVTVYDGNPENGVSEPEIAWWPNGPVSGDAGDDVDVVVVPGAGRTIRAIVLLPDHGQGRGRGLAWGRRFKDADDETLDLGFSVENNTALGALIDHRGSPSSLTFLVSEGRVGKVNVRTSLTGSRLNFLELPGGWELPHDIDDDGNLVDYTSFYTPGSLRGMLARGSIDGDVVAGGNVGYVVAQSRGAVPPGLARRIQVGNVAIGGDIRTPGSVRLIHAGSGDIAGTVDVGGNLGRLRTFDGSITGTVAVGGNVNQILVRDGDMAGDVTVGGNLKVLKVIRGDVTGSVAVDGNQNLALAIPHGRHGGGAIPGSIAVQGNAHTIKALGGGTGDVTVGGNLHLLMARNGDAAGDVAVDGYLHVLKVHDGSLTGDLTVGGDALLVGIQRGGVTGEISVDGTLRQLKLHRGDLAAPVSVGGHAVLVQVIGGDLAGSVTVGGRMHRLAVTRAAGRGGMIDLTEDRRITVGRYAGTIKTQGGGIVDDDETAPDIVVTGGNLTRLQVVRGTLDHVNVRVHGGGGGGGNLRSVAVVGRGGGVSHSHITADSTLRSVLVNHGDLYNTTIDAHALGRVMVTGRGRIHSDRADGDEIHARVGRFYARDTTWGGWVTSWNSHEFDGVLAHVG